MRDAGRIQGLTFPLEMKFPECVSIRVTPPLPAGLAVSLRFHMKQKNSFTYIVFSDTNGAAEVRSDVLLTSFDQDRDTFLMDYKDPRAAFDGGITARIMSVDELKDALAAYETFREGLSFPCDYLKHLQFALTLGDQTSGHTVGVFA